MRVLTVARCQGVRGMSSYQTGRQLPDIQIIHLSPHSRVSGCNIGLESPLRIVLTGWGLDSRKVRCGKFLWWIFLQNNSSTDGWEGRSDIFFAGRSLDVYEVCVRKKSVS